MGCLCGSDVPSRVAYVVNGCAIRVCLSCRAGRADTRGFEPERYYTKGYFDGGRTDGYADYVGSSSVLRREFRRDVRVLQRYVPSGDVGGRGDRRTLVEIGSAYGYFLDEALTYYDARGIEICGEAVAACRARGLEVHEGAVDRGVLERIGPLDALVMLDVIEHLVDPRATLTLAVERLRPGGVVLLTTGDFGSLDARFLGSRWRLMTPPQHLWFFTVASLRSLAAQLRLEVVEVAHPWKRVPGSLIAYQLARMAGLRHPDPAGTSWLSRVGIPVNLFDAMRCVLRKPASL